MAGKVDLKTAARRVEQLHISMGQRMPSGLTVVAESIMTDVKSSRPGRGVPRDTGALAASGRVSRPRVSKGKITVRLGFGGAAAPYALYQHEMMSLRHTLGEARYLVRGVERFQTQGFKAATTALREVARAAIHAAAKKR